MSIEATLATWKLSKNHVTATEKLFLLSCANRAGENHECWPSLKRLITDTGFDRKTVIKIRQAVIEKNLMEYTGEHKGHSKQIPIMRLTYVIQLVELLDDKYTSPKNGTGAEIGTGTSTEIGTGTSTVFGTLNLKEESKRLNKKISASGESQNIGYTESDGEEGEHGKSDYKSNQAEIEKMDAQVLDVEINPIRSDYFENQTKNQTVSKLSIPQELKILQEENIFSIPDQAILDWIANRKKKRVPITPTAWKKINKELAKCKEHGLDPVETFETFVANGWQSFKLEWFLKDQDSSQNEGKNSGQSSLKNYW